MLKKFKVITPFNGYRAGITVAFNGADAEKYKAFIVSTAAQEVVAPVVAEEKNVAEEKPARKVRKIVKKGRK